MIENKELLTILIAASPLSELRGAIPTAIFVWNFSWYKAFLLSVFGNLLPIFPLMIFWEYLSGSLMEKSVVFKNFCQWLFSYTRNKHQDHFNKWKDLALMIFVAIPLPFTGAWSGVLAAYVFGIPKSKAFPMIALGVLFAGIAVLLLSLGGKSL